MNEFRTIINPGNAGFKADLATPVMAIGSCFASHMAARLDKHGLPVSAHPFGIVYHPLAIGRQLQLLNKKSSFDPARIVKDNDHFKHLDAHGDLHAESEDALVELLAKEHEKQADNFDASQFLIITFGTAFAYHWQQDQKVVANCHKQAAADFTRKIHKADDMAASLMPLLNAYLEKNSQRQIILTVSPVRHLRDNPAENQHSKSQLHCLAHALTEADRIHYFPAYEILMDDLRDYRFYEADMCHPNELATDYIWEKFRHWFYQQDDFFKEVGNIHKRQQHRSRQAGSEEDLAFQQTTQEKIDSLKNKWPGLRYDRIRPD